MSCFVTDKIFATKSGDYGMVLRLQGMDSECLTEERLETVVSALMGAFHLFGDQFRLYQYLVKNRKTPIIRKGSYDNPLVEEAVSDRISFLEKNAPLGAISLYVVVLFESRLNAHGRRRTLSAAQMREDRAKAWWRSKQRSTPLFNTSKICLRHASYRNRNRAGSSASC